MRESDISAVLASLTPKQREVMDLLIQHKTSKEIARELGISPHTVDQRVQFAKDKLGVESRSEAAVEYRRLVALCQSPVSTAAQPPGQGTYEESRSAGIAVPADQGGTRNSNDPAASMPPKRSKPDEMIGQGHGYSIVPEMFEGRYGTAMRLGAIVLVTVLLLFITLGGLAVFDRLSRSLAG